MKTGDCKLSRLVSEYHMIQEEENDFHNDVSMWGAPSECHLDVTAMYSEEWSDFWLKVSAIYGDIEKFKQLLNEE